MTGEPCRCPTCGGEVPRLTLDMLILAAGLTGNQEKIMRAIWNAGGYSVPTERLMDVLYGHREDGGPESTASLRTTIRFIRRRIEPFGVYILTYTTVGYRLSFTAVHARKQGYQTIVERYEPPVASDRIMVVPPPHGRIDGRTNGRKPKEANGAGDPTHS